MKKIKNIVNKLTSILSLPLPLLLLLLFIVLFTLVESNLETQSKEVEANTPLIINENKTQTNLAKVVRVIDADTVSVELDNEVIKIRNIGIDAPEAGECYFEQANDKARSILDDQNIFIELDDSQGQFDKYNRTLAYIKLPNGEYYEEKMLREGSAREYTYNKPYHNQTAYKKAEAVAITNSVGLWNCND